MLPYILDSSAIIALIQKEKGAEIVAMHLKGAIMSGVNFSEVVAVLAKKMPRQSIITALTNLVADIVPFDEEQALETGMLYQQTWLSFGDRACLTLAKVRGLPILTADKIWLNLKLDLEIKMIR
jgi:PIN domain nuclease of toxin-antitoxin system